METIDSRPSNPGTSQNKLIFYKVERLIQSLLAKAKLKRNLDVTELYLANEEISDIPPLDQFKNLTRLWLQNNRIKKLNFFQNNDALSEIYLQNNLIQDIRFCFRGLKNIRVLFLNGNQLYNLDDVTNELSYLQYIENLNLFDNPIALEKNYRNRLIHVIPNLKCLDRNMVTKKERENCHKMYETERVEVESRYAFLRCIETPKETGNFIRKTSFVNSSISSDRKFKKATKSSGSNLNESYLMGSVDDLDLQQQQQQQNKNSQKLKIYPRTIQEFSYFDWSKVKLYENKYKDDEDRSLENMELNNDLDDMDNLLVDQPRIKPNNDVSQVITIRFQ